MVYIYTCFVYNISYHVIIINQNFSHVNRPKVLFFKSLAPVPKYCPKLAAAVRTDFRQPKVIVVVFQFALRRQAWKISGYQKSVYNKGCATYNRDMPTNHNTAATVSDERQTERWKRRRIAKAAFSLVDALTSISDSCPEDHDDVFAEARTLLHSLGLMQWSSQDHTQDSQIRLMVEILYAAKHDLGFEVLNCVNEMHGRRTRYDLYGKLVEACRCGRDRGPLDCPYCEEKP